MSAPLSGLRVVELAVAIQGPAAGLHFANMGADVIKVEPPFGDASRYGRGANCSHPPDVPGSQFIAMNKGKRSVTLDVHTPLGNEAMHRLLASADVFLTNYRASALTRMGLDLRTLVDTYPKLVVGHANGFGPRGDDAEKAMLDGAAQARGGLVSMTGMPDEGPVVPGAAVADHAGAMQLALGIMTALVARATTGRGQLVETSSLGGQLWLQMWELQHSALTGVPLTRAGRHHPNIRSQYGIYETADGEHLMFVTAQTEEAWSSFWIFLDRPDVLLLEEWNSPAKRLGFDGSEVGLADIRMHMRDAIGTKTMAELEAFLYTQPEIIWERVRGHADVLTDPQNLANEYITDLELDAAGTVKTTGPLMHFSATPPPATRPPPGLAADTGPVLTELGFSESEVQSVLDHAEAVRQELMAAVLGES
jgi:crotonobetainyl-CoA:carnitine CoA-transferase CaiB-like acyl-CoA transferase